MPDIVMPLGRTLKRRCEFEHEESRWKERERHPVRSRYCYGARAEDAEDE